MTAPKTATALFFAGLTIWALTLIVIPWTQHGLDTAQLAISVPVLRQIALVGAVIGMLCLFAGFGLHTTGALLGIAESGRNTYSLSRVQMVGWTLLVLSGLLAAAACRAWGLGTTGGLAAALSIDIDNNLLIAMGISYFTGAATPTILAIKAQATTQPGQTEAAATRMGEPVQANGQVIGRPPEATPSVADIVQGDDLATAGTIDLSKVQQLLVTILLISIYFAMLWGLFAGSVFEVPVPIGTGADVKTQLMTRLPVLNSNFINLLLLSHAGYLAYKAAPRSATGTTPAEPQRPSTPGRAF